MPLSWNEIKDRALKLWENETSKDAEVTVSGFKVGIARRFRKGEIDKWIKQQEASSNAK